MRPSSFVVALLSTLTAYGLAAGPKPADDTPNVISTVQLPPATTGEATSNRIGDFISGPDKPVVIDDDTRAKLKDLAATYQKVAVDNYPLIIKTLHLEGKPASTKVVHIVVTYGYDGVAATSGTADGPRIEVSAKYALAHPADVGMIVHEMVHVVQNYKHYNDNDAPGWLVEGIADYVRWFFYEPISKRPHPRLPRADAKGSYQTTASFLFWASNKYNNDLVPKLNAALQDNTYTEGSFKDLTGKTLDELDTEWKATLTS